MSDLLGAECAAKKVLPRVIEVAGELFCLDVRAMEYKKAASDTQVLYSFCDPSHAKDTIGHTVVREISAMAKRIASLDNMLDYHGICSFSGEKQEQCECHDCGRSVLDMGST